MPNLRGESANSGQPAVAGIHSADGTGVVAQSAQGIGLEAIATKNRAVYAHSETSIGISGSSQTNHGVLGKSEDGTGVFAQSTRGIGLQAIAIGNTAVYANSRTGIGVHGYASGGRGVVAESNQSIALEAIATKDTAVYAHSNTGMGVNAYSKTHAGVWAVSEEGTAIVAESRQGVALEAKANREAAVLAVSEQGIGVRGRGGQYAGYFEGIVMVTGDLQLQNADCAEDFDVLAAEKIEPGTVMVIDSDGAMRPSTKSYDKCVAGVVSGAGDFKPGLILGKHAEKPNRLPIALMGKVYCKVDADFGSIEIGDLLTTSSTPGHAMKASDPHQAFGAVIGKALRPWAKGQGLIPILVALQ